MHEKWKFLFQHTSGIGLDDGYRLGNGYFGSNRTKDMDVVKVSINFDDLKFRMTTLKALYQNTEVTANTAL